MKNMSMWQEGEWIAAIAIILLAVFLAIGNMLEGVSRYTGIDAPRTSEWAGLLTSYSETLLIGQGTRMYPIASVAIARGQVVNLWNDGGVLKARLAQANSATTMAHGLANTAAGIGAQVEINLWQTWTNAIGALTPGSLYYLAPGTAGAVQATRPSVGGQIIQSVGVALSANDFSFNASSQYQQL